MDSRRSVLIVSFYFPPAGGGGVQRILKWAKYLPEYGIDVHVLTPDDPRWIDVDPQLEVPAGITVHRAAYRGLSPGQPRQILHGSRGLRRLWRRLLLQPRRLLVPDVVATWRLTAIRAGARIVREHGIDVVLSTSPPPTDHIVARGIADRTGIPMVADLRDSWLHDPRLRLGARSVRAKRRIAARMEARTVGRADAVITAAPSISDEIRERYPGRAGQVHTIENGVDLADFRDDAALARPDRFVITHTGGFFGLRRPGPFLDAVEHFAREHPQRAESLLVRFVGQVPADDAERIDHNPTLSAIVERCGFVPWRAALAHQRAADALLLLIPNTPDRRGMVTGKLFEYLGARRPILALVPPHGAASDLVESTGSGVAMAPEDAGAIAEQLRTWIDAWTPDTEPLELPPLDADTTARISRRGGAERLARILADVCRSATPRRSTR